MKRARERRRLGGTEEDGGGKEEEGSRKKEGGGRGKEPYLLCLKRRPWPGLTERTLLRHHLLDFARVNARHDPHPRLRAVVAASDVGAFDPPAGYRRLAGRIEEVLKDEEEGVGGGGLGGLLLMLAAFDATVLDLLHLTHTHTLEYYYTLHCCEFSLVLSLFLYFRLSLSLSLSLSLFWSPSLGDSTTHLA